MSARPDDTEDALVYREYLDEMRRDFWSEDTAADDGPDDDEYDGWSQADLEQQADGAAADAVFGRWAS